MKEETDAERGFRLRMMGFFLFVATLPIYGAFAHCNREATGLAVACTVGIFCIVAYVRRASLKHATFAFVLFGLFVIQMVVALLVRLPDRFPGVVIAPFAFGDLFAVLWIMSVVGNDQRK